jgi:hypothetical protein
MKISNIIITALAITVIASMMVLFIDAKNHQNYKNPNIETKTFLLSDFTVVVAEKGADVHINSSDTNSIAIEYIKNQVVKNQLYKQKNDTLFVYGGLRTFVKCSKLKAIQANKAFWVGVIQFKLDSLDVTINSGRLNFIANDSIRNEFNKLVINASDSAIIYTSNISVENFVLNAKTKANCEFYGNYKHVDVKLSNNSTLFFNSNPLTIKLEQDKKSSFRIR